MRSRIFIAIVYMVSFQFCFSQKTVEYKTWNPANDTMQVLEGQAWPHEVKDFYDRLPARAAKDVSERTSSSGISRGICSSARSSG